VNLIFTFGLESKGTEYLIHITNKNFDLIYIEDEALTKCCYSKQIKIP